MKYRIIRQGARFVIQTKGWFGWSQWDYFFTLAQATERLDKEQQACRDHHNPPVLHQREFGNDGISIDSLENR